MTGPATAPARTHRLSVLLAGLVLSILIPTILLTGGLLWRVGVLDQERANQQALQLAKAVAADIDREIEGNVATLRALASSPSLMQGNLEAFYRQATDTLAFRRLHVLLKMPDGQQILNTRVPLGTALPKSPLSAADRNLLSSRQVQITDLVIGGVTQSWVLGRSVPVLLNDSVRYILTMSIDP